MKLEELKATNARSTGTTMQYFVQAAKRMGMIDGDHGIRYAKKGNDTEGKPPSDIVSSRSEGSSMISAARTNSDISGDSSSRNTIKNGTSKATESSDGSSESLQPGVSFNLSMDLSVGGHAKSKSIVKKDMSGREEGKHFSDVIIPQYIF